VGKTIVTAAIAGLARAAGRSVAVVKPAQTGVRPAYPKGSAYSKDTAYPKNGAYPKDTAYSKDTAHPDGDVPDIETVTALSGVTDTHELARFPDPLSPEAAARTSGLPPLDVTEAADYISMLAAERDLVLVEGAGGLLVRYDPAGRTLADLAAALRAPVLIVAAAGLGTLNHTALTCEALRNRGLRTAGVVIGSWPASPGLAEMQNLRDLPAAAGAPLLGMLPEGAAQLSQPDFLAAASAALSPVLNSLCSFPPHSPPSHSPPSC
jgi:dethiobiotin synthetase